jgi:hypothetical protein
MTARLDEDGRCVRTELPPEMCACPDHRGGQLLTDLEAAHGQGLASQRRDADDHTRDRWGSPAFTAGYGGVCGWCESPFLAGAKVRYDAEDTLVGPCCAESDTGFPIGMTELDI